jgi:hypothetical protein
MAALILASLSLAAAQTAPGKAQAGFDRLKTLVGEWKGTAGTGQTATLSYRLVSNGSALEETMNVGKEETMITMYHLDRDRIMVTHYCAAGNQPRMVTTPDSNTPDVFSFKFLDITNLSDSQIGHMRDLVLTLVDKNHFTQQWVWREKGTEEKMELFKWTRTQ